MRKLIVVAALLLSGAFQAKATTYDVNIFAPPPAGVTLGPSGQASTNACSATSCAGGINTAYSFQVQPGDTINFGTLSLEAFIFGDGRQEQFTEYLDENGQLQFGFGIPIALYPGSLVTSFVYNPFLLLGNEPAAQCNSADPSCIPRLQSLAGPPTNYNLTFTLPEGFIELGWTDYYQYTPPTEIGAVPEPSTWAMLLIGFAGLGWLLVRPRALPATLSLSCKHRLHGDS
jgi:hypothetical protein